MDLLTVAAQAEPQSRARFERRYLNYQAVGHGPNPELGLAISTVGGEGAFNWTRQNADRSSPHGELADDEVDWQDNHPVRCCQ